MPTNTIALFKSYVPLLDQVYKLAALTSVLDGPAEMVRAGANAGEIVVPVMSMQGLVNYAKNGGTTYTEGTVTMTNQTYSCGYNRGRIFSVDTLENQETAGIAFGRLAGEFIRTKVAPDIDAYLRTRPGGQERLSDTEVLEEKLMLALRTVRGLDLDSLTPAERAGLKQTTLEELSRVGKLIVDAGRIRIPAAELFVSDDIICRLIPASACTA